MSTPRTDAAEWHTRTPGNPVGMDVVASSFARQLERELEEAKADRQWRPIETAPREVALVLVFVSMTSDITVAALIQQDGKWINAWTGRALHYQPTHWMPLPEPPKDDK